MGRKATKSEKPGVMIYFEIMPQLEMLKPLQRLAVYDAIMAYGKDRTEPSLKREGELVWAFIRPILDRDDERYRRTVEARSKGGKLTAAKAKKKKEAQNSAEACSAVLSSAEGMLNRAEDCSDCQSTISNPQSAIFNPQSANCNLQSAILNLQTPVGRERGSGSGTASDSLEGFVPPSLPQVKEFVLKEGLRFVPEDFTDYYNANGWMIGQQPIRDWKAVARRWDRKEKHHADCALDGIDLGPGC